MVNPRWRPQPKTWNTCNSAFTWDSKDIPSASRLSYGSSYPMGQTIMLYDTLQSMKDKTVCNFFSQIGITFLQYKFCRRWSRQKVIKRCTLCWAATYGVHARPFATNVQQDKYFWVQRMIWEIVTKCWQSPDWSDWRKDIVVACYVLFGISAVFQIE